MTDNFNFDLFLLRAEQSRRQVERKQETLRKLTDEQLEQRIEEAEKEWQLNMMRQLSKEA